MTSFPLTEESIDLGAFDSHSLEHLFENTKRMSAGNNTYQNLIKTPILVYAESKRCDIYEIEMLKVYGRNESSAN